MNETLELALTLISSITHELKNPIRAVGFFAEQGERELAKGDNDEATSAALRELFPKIVSAAREAFEKMEAMVEVASEVSAAFKDGERGFGEVARSYRLALVELADLQEQTGAEVTYTQKTIPAVALSNGALFFLFYNVFQNAMKHGRPGVVPEVFVDVSFDKNNVTVKIKDNGIGLAHEEQLARIFDLFFRARQDTEGDGIGLAFCRLLLASVGGSIGAEQNDDFGLTITMKIPRAMKGHKK